MIYLTDEAIKAVEKGEPLSPETGFTVVERTNEGATIKGNAEFWLYIADALLDASSSPAPRHGSAYGILLQILREHLGLVAR